MNPDEEGTLSLSRLHRIIILVSIFMFASDFCFGQQSVGTPTSQIDSMQTREEIVYRYSLCLMGSFSVGLYGPLLDTAYIQDFGYWGYAFKLGCIWNNRLVQFDYHHA